MKYFIFKILPKNLISRLTGYLVHVKLPYFLSKRLIYTFAKVYHINLAETEKSYDQYSSVGDLFTRKLKAGARPIAQGAAIVHPADSLITQTKEITQGRLIQAKGKFYSVMDLCQDQKAQEHFENGIFLTYYLCPTDYHRVHSPVNGEIISITHIPGDLWPVNAWSAENVENLFPKNERVVLNIKSEFGLVALVFVGATNVGQISLSFEPSFRTNSALLTIPQTQYCSVKVQVGQELGVFHMGSTVVMLYPEAVKKQYPDCPKWLGQRVHVGEKF